MSCLSGASYSQRMRFGFSNATVPFDSSGVASVGDSIVWRKSAASVRVVS